MFKWHAHSALGRGRPAAHDLARVTDGIAASLRQFSISASRYAEDNGNGDILRTKSSSRSSDIFQEVSSLTPRPSRGIDARSLAARPPPSFTIRRTEVDDHSPRPMQSFMSRTAPRVPPRPSGPNRSGLRSGARVGQGRGARGRGRGRGTRRQGRGGQHSKDAEDDEEPTPLTPEELAYVDERNGGFQAPYKPVTSAEDLARWGPPVMSSSRGVVESLVYKMAVATDNVNPEFKSAASHHDKLMDGAGTLFENATERKRSKGVYRKAGKLTKDDKEAMMKQWVAGQYVPAQNDKGLGDVLAQVAAYTRRNETYLPADTRKFEKTLKALLPDSMRGPAPQQAQQAKRKL